VSGPPRRKLDTTALSGLAHPLRVRLFEALTQYGSATATQLARRLAESSGATSYHLRQLERFGFVETDPDRGTGRERWWRRVPGMVVISPPEGGAEADPAGQAAFKLLVNEFQRNRLARHRRWIATSEQWPIEWQEASNELTTHLVLTADELCQLAEELEAVTAAWKTRLADRLPDAASRPVEVQQSLFPLPALEEAPPER
jgi:DNA-binding transcriptional ArsR family regulator